ncbi:MAG: saccharopine dehydrogenase C-terminal domain-containing protein [Gemmatimonadota bacterium]
MRFLVLGGGAQGSAAAYDLLTSTPDSQVVVADIRVGDPPAFLRGFPPARLSFTALDATDGVAVARAMEGMDAVLCGLPYYLNYDMAALAVEAGAHFCDLGGNTEIVERQRGLDGRAREKGVSVVADCGLAPGMVNILAQAGIDALDETDSVRMWVGGLPQHPRPPLNYQVVYSLEGVLDYYTTPGVILKDGEKVPVEPLDGMEILDLPGVGKVEAFFTAGGISTMPDRYEGRIPRMEYKTVRYPGHAHIMRAIRELGLLSQDPVELDGADMIPRQAFIAVVKPHLQNPEGNDLVVARVEVRGRSNGKATGLRWDLLDHYDAATGITAMMRTTGFSLAITALLQTESGAVEAGVHTPDEAIPADAYVDALARRGVRIHREELREE